MIPALGALLAALTGWPALPGSGLLWALSLAAAAGIFIAVLVLLRRMQPEYRMAAWAVLGYLVFLIAASLISGNLFLFQFRFLIPVLPYWVLLIAAQADVLPAGRFRMIAVSIFMLMGLRVAFSALQYAALFRADVPGRRLVKEDPRQEPYQAAAAALSRRPASDTLLFRNWRLAQSLSWYLKADTLHFMRYEPALKHSLEFRDASANTVGLMDLPDRQYPGNGAL
jgi:hypothetical protein